MSLKYDKMDQRTKKQSKRQFELDEERKVRTHMHGCVASARLGSHRHLILNSHFTSQKIMDEIGDAPLEIKPLPKPPGEEFDDDD